MKKKLDWAVLGAVSSVAASTQEQKQQQTFVAQEMKKRKEIFTRFEHFDKDMKFKEKKKANNGCRVSGRFKRHHTTKWN